MKDMLLITGCNVTCSDPLTNKVVVYCQQFTIIGVPDLLVEFLHCILVSYLVLRMKPLISNLYFRLLFHMLLVAYLFFSV